MSWVDYSDTLRMSYFKADILDVSYRFYFPLQVVQKRSKSGEVHAVTYTMT